MTDSDQSASKAVYTATPIDAPISRFENDYISVRQDAQSVTTGHTTADEWIQTGTGAGATAQTLILETGGSKQVFLQNSLAPSGSLNEIKVTRGGVYKAIYSAQIEYSVGPNVVDVELGIGYSSTDTSTSTIVHNTPLERALRIQPQIDQTSGIVNEHATGSVVLRLPAGSVLRLYDRTITTAQVGSSNPDITILNADITLQRLGRDGQ